MSIAQPKHRPTVDGLYRAPGKAELVNGEVVLMPPTGGRPADSVFKIAVSLHLYALRTGRGRAIGDNVGFLVNLPNRRSFSPDAAFWDGPDPTMKFYEGAPPFAVEVRSENDYGPVAERALAAKRSDYFAAGTLVVWDVDLKSDDVVRIYRTDRPTAATCCCREDTADAEPAVPGWTMAVRDIV